MEIIEREIKSSVKENQCDMSCSLIDGIRLCMRWKITDKEDLLVNLTEKETKHLGRLFE